MTIHLTASTAASLRRMIADARGQPLDPDARPYVILKVIRKTPPLMRVRVLGCSGEVIGTVRDGGGWLCTARVFCDDLERSMRRMVVEADEEGA